MTMMKPVPPNWSITIFEYVLYVVQLIIRRLSKAQLNISLMIH